MRCVSWHPKCHFVGPCFKPSIEATSKVGLAGMDNVKQWLDIAASQKHDVVSVRTLY